MKNILAKYIGTIKAFIANPQAEFPKAIFKNKLTGADEVKAHGFTQKQQALLIITLLQENGLMVEADTQEQRMTDFCTALEIIYDLGNGSAARQAMEKAGILGESPTGKRGTDVSALAAKWMPSTTPAPTPEEVAAMKAGATQVG